MPNVTRPNSDVTAALRRAGVNGVDDSPLAQALYATDASLYRVLPRVVVRPHEVSELEGVLAVARASETAITMRGGWYLNCRQRRWPGNRRGHHPA